MKLFVYQQYKDHGLAVKYDVTFMNSCVHETLCVQQYKDHGLAVKNDGSLYI